MLRYAAKYRKEADPELHQGLLLAATEVLDGLPVRRGCIYRIPLREAEIIAITPALR